MYVLLYIHAYITGTLRVLREKFHDGICQKVFGINYNTMYLQLGPAQSFLRPMTK